MPAATHTRFFHAGSPDEPFRLRDGGQLPGFTLAYETWGELNADGSNAILLFHALSGSHHAAGFNPAIEGVGELWQPEMHDGWWDDMIGPGKALDTQKYFIICANYLGGCYGSTGPASINPATGKPWGSSSPRSPRRTRRRFSVSCSITSASSAPRRGRALRGRPDRADLRHTLSRTG